jgi:hypothetical protein
VFFSIINNVKKVNEIKDFGIKEDQFTQKMREVFGTHPNIKNLKEFFKHEVV